MINRIAHAIPVHSRWKLAIKTAPFVMIIILIKLLVHYLGFEVLTLNSLFTAIVSANIFLIGFLITGVLTDYKESEKIPGDMASSIATMLDEGLIINEQKNSEESKSYILHIKKFNESLIDWFYKKERIENIMDRLLEFNRYFIAFESQTQANFIVRLKQEQNLMRRMINRVHTIRETSFLGTGYAIAEIITSILTAGMICIKIEPFYESIFFISFVSFILIYMIFFIKDLDNPFGYSKEDNLIEEVSLKPILDNQKRIEAYCNQMKM